MKCIDEMIQKIQDNASRYDDDYMIAHLELAKKLCEISKVAGDIWYLDKIAQTFCEILETQQEIIEELKLEMDQLNDGAGYHMVPSETTKSNFIPCPQGTVVVAEEETESLLEIPQGGIFKDSLQVKKAFFSFLQGIRKKGKPLSPTTIYDYSSRINMLSVYFEREWKAGKFEGRFQICEENFTPGETYLNVYKNIELFAAFVKDKEDEIKAREREESHFSAEELSACPLLNAKNLRNSYAALAKFREFKNRVAKLVTARSEI